MDHKSTSDFAEAVGKAFAQFGHLEEVSVWETERGLVAEAKITHRGRRYEVTAKPEESDG